MPQQRRRVDRLGRPIKTTADYAQMMTTAIVLTIVIIGLFALAYWLDQRYGFSRQIELPANISSKLPPQAMGICVPLGMALMVFLMVQSFIATIISRFYRRPQDELDEDGLYKHRGEGY